MSGEKHIKTDQSSGLTYNDELVNIFPLRTAIDLIKGFAEVISKRTSSIR